MNLYSVNPLPKEYKIEPLPQPVGYWILPGAGASKIKFSAYKRPRWLTIKMMSLIFEWKWEDGNEHR